MIRGESPLSPSADFPIPLPSPLPVIAIPLLPADPDVEVDLQSVFNRCYDTAQFGRHIDYTTDSLLPPLSDEQAAWVDDVLNARQQEVPI